MIYRTFVVSVIDNDADFERAVHLLPSERVVGVSTLPDLDESGNVQLVVLLERPPGLHGMQRGRK